MTYPTVQADAYAVKLVVTMDGMTEGDEGYVNDAWQNDIGAWASFGIGGSQLGQPGTEYAAILPGLANRAYIYSGGGSDGIALYVGGSAPIDAFILNARVCGWDPADNRMDTPAGFKCGTSVGHDGDVAVGGTTFHFKGGLFVGVN